MTSTRRLLSVVSIASIAAAATVAIAAPAVAATTPAYEPDKNAIGSISFYDASGRQVTGGSDLSHLFDYAVASTDAARKTTNKATVFFAFPDHTQADSNNWSVKQAVPSTDYPVTSGPAGITGQPAHRPVSTAGPTDANLAAPLQVQTLDTTDGYKNLVQLRLKDSGPGVGNGQQSKFWASDIEFDQAAGTWRQAYPSVVAATPTTTSLGATPASPQKRGTSVTFTATVAPAAAAGTVQFKDGATALGAAQPVSGGNAQYSTTALTPGSHAISAVFTPTDPAAYQASNSQTLTYVVNDVADAPTNLSATPLDGAANVQWNAPANVNGSAITGYDLEYSTNGTTFQPVPGTQTSTATSAKVTSLTNGTEYTFKVAAINSVGTGPFSATSKVTPLKNVVPTKTTLTAMPASPQKADTNLTFKATVDQTAATGSISFKDGATVLTSVQVSSGTASFTTKLAKGQHPITATFTSADPASYGSSTSTVLPYVIADAPAAPQTVKATPVNGSAAISWATPTDDGGTPITGYAIQQSTDGVTWSATAAGNTRTSTATTATVTGLTNGVGYFFRVLAINGVGASAYQVTSAKVVPIADATLVSSSGPGSAKYRATVTVVGRAVNARTHAPLRGARLALYLRRAPAAGFVRGITVVTDARGIASARIAALANTVYQWRYTATPAQRAGVSVYRSLSVAQVVTASRTPATVKHGKSARVYGTVSSVGKGQRVYLQRSIGSGRYATVASAVITTQKLPNGRRATGFVLSTKLKKKGTYVFRVYKPATNALAAGYSATQKVRAS